MQPHDASPLPPRKPARAGRQARPRLRFAIDAAFGLAVFLALTAAMLGPSAAASLLGLDPVPGTLANGSNTVPLFVSNYSNAWEQDGMNMKFLMLAAVFSALFALNNAFVRHLRKAYIRSYKAGSRAAKD